MLELNKVYQMDALEGMKLLQSNSVDLIITDPPYPINRDNGTGRLFNGHDQEKEWFKNSYDNWDNFILECLKEMKRVLKVGGHFYFFVNETNLFTMKPILDKYFIFKSLLIWHKGSKAGESYGMGYHYRKSCEYIFLYSKGKSKRFITNHGTLLHYPRNNYNIDHPTPKPVDMCRLFIEKSSDKDFIVLDPFIGSGTVAIACKQLDRKFIGFDIDKKYIDLTEKRLNQKLLNINEM